jgi:WD40 repeat protein
MTCKWTLALLLIACATTAFAASQPVANLQLPCESRFQILSPAGNQLAVVCPAHKLLVVDLPAGKQPRPLEVGGNVNLDSATYSPDGRWLAVGFNEGSIELFSTQTLSSAKRWKADAHRIDVLHFSPDGKWLFVGPVDSPGQVWDLRQTPTLLARVPVDFGGINAFALSPDGKLLVAAGDDTVVRWYDTTTWQRTLENRDFLLETFALAFTPDGKQLLAGGADSRITVLDAATAKAVRQLPAQAGSYIVAIELLGNKQHAAALYLDDAGEKPPQGLLWDLADAKSTKLGSNTPPTCGGVVAGKLWMCSADKDTLRISQFE